jgi:hypothetical protein
VAVIGNDYWGQNLVRNFADLDSARVVFDRRRRGRHPDVAPGTVVIDIPARIVRRMDQNARGSGHKGEEL